MRPAPTESDSQSMLFHLRLLLHALALAHGITKHIAHKELKLTQLGLQDALSDVGGMIDQYKERTQEAAE